MSRERVFLLCVKTGHELKVVEAGPAMSLDFELVRDSCNVQLSSQDLNLMTARDVELRARAVWNPHGEKSLDLVDWLLADKVPDHEARLKCIGNAVIPKMATHALHTMATHMANSG